MAYTQQTFISHSFGGQKVQGEDLMSGESPFPGSLLYPDKVERDTLVSSAPNKGTNPVHEASTLMT